MRILEKARQEYGDAGFITFYLGVEHQRIGDYQKALEYFTKSLSNSSVTESYTPPMVRNMVYCLMNLNRYQDGLNLIDKYLKVYPDYTDLMYLKGVLYYGQDKYSEALDCMNQCIAMGPPPQGYFLSTHGIADEKPKMLINTLIQSLIRNGSELVNQGSTSKAFSVLETVFSQLKKMPDEDSYKKLIETMLALKNTLN